MDMVLNQTTDYNSSDLITTSTISFYFYFFCSYLIITKSTSETEYFSHNDNDTLNTDGSFVNQTTMPMAKITLFGSWAPYQQPAIDTILKQGYNE